MALFHIAWTVAADETEWREDRHSVVPSGGQRGTGQAGLLRGGSQ